jgi:hypothetical protein
MNKYTITYDKEGKGSIDVMANDHMEAIKKGAENLGLKMYEFQQHILEIRKIG